MVDIKVLLRLKRSDIHVEIKESFQLVKKRLFNGQNFVELTLLGSDKKIYNKDVISEITRTESIGKPKKKGK